MQTLFFLLFCAAVGYVLVWVLMNEQRGNLNGEWGLLAMRKSEDTSSDKAPAAPGQHSGHRGWKP